MAGPFACLKETGNKVAVTLFPGPARADKEDARNRVTATLFPQPAPIEVPVVKILV